MSEQAEAFVSLIGGMNAGLDSSLLQPTQYAFGINVSSRGGLIHSRPAFVERPIGLGSFTTGLFQGSMSYPLNSADRVVCVISGRVLGIQVNNLEITDYSAQVAAGPDTGLMDAEVERCYFCKADKFMIVQDGINPAIIIDGATARRAVHSTPPQATDEIPLGTIMAYGHGRLFVVPVAVEDQDGRRFFHAGNILLPTDPTSIFKFTEADTITGGGAFSLPNEMGFITGMAFMQNASSGSGVGALVVFAQRGASAFAVNASRSTWPDIDISQVLFQTIGTYSPRSMVPVNNDLYFRASDGIRSLHYAISEISQGSNGIRNSAISREVQTILNRDSRASWAFVDMAYVDNRLFCMSVPIDDDKEMRFKALIVLDADTASSMATPSAPIYDGTWIGEEFMALAVARHSTRERNTLYAFTKKDDENHFMMLELDGYQDESEDLACRVYTKAYAFKDIVNMKVLQYAQVDLSQLKGDVIMRAFYRPHGYPYWGRLGSPHKMIANSAGQYQRRQSIRFTPPDDAGDTINQIRLSQAHSFEFCFQWKGYAQIDAAIFEAAIQADISKVACGTEEDRGPLGSGLDLDPFGDYTIFDEFIPQPDDYWKPYPFVWRPRPGTNLIDIKTTLYPEIPFPVMPWTVADVSDLIDNLNGNDDYDPDLQLPMTYNWSNDPGEEKKPFLAMQSSWLTGGGVFNGTTDTPPEPQYIEMWILSSFQNPSASFRLYGTDAGMVSISEESRTETNLLNLTLITPAFTYLAALPFFLTVVKFKVEVRYS